MIGSITGDIARIMHNIYDGSPMPGVEVTDNAIMLKDWKAFTEWLSAKICDRWVERLGLGFHPDTRGADYEPPLVEPGMDADNYDADIDTLFIVSMDPYADAVAAMKRAGLVEG